jgi:hypothetical protein
MKDSIRGNETGFHRHTGRGGQDDTDDSARDETLSARICPHLLDSPGVRAIRFDIIFNISLLAKSCQRTNSYRTIVALKKNCATGGLPSIFRLSK